MPDTAAPRAVDTADEAAPTLHVAPSPAASPAAQVAAPGAAPDATRVAASPDDPAPVVRTAAPDDVYDDREAPVRRERTPEEVVRGWQAALTRAGSPDTLLEAGRSEAVWLDLTKAHPSGIAQLMAGRPTRLSSLVREPAAHAAARRRARGIRAVADELAAERGVRAGFLAAGLATWRPGPLRVLDVEAGGGAVQAPVLLRACTLRPRDAGHDDYDVDLDGTPMVNPELLRRLEEEHAIRPERDALAGLSFGRDGFDPRPVFDRLEELCADVPGFRIDRVIALAALTSGSGAIVADLGAASPSLVVHPLLGRVVREEAAAELREVAAPEWEAASTRPGQARDPRSDEELLPLDLDLGQHRAVDAALAGEHVALEGPPGSGLTHTLAAIAASLAARGRRSLVVTPRRASADAFVARLAAAGLGDLVLDLQDGVGDRTGLHTALSAALETALDGSAIEASRARPGFEDQLHATIADSRALLDGSTTALHEVRRPWGVSAFAAMSRLSDLMNRPPAPRTTVRLPRQVLDRLDDDERARLRGLLVEAAEAGAFSGSTRLSAWFDASVADDATVATALAAARSARDNLPAARAQMAAVAAAAGLQTATSAARWRPQLDLLVGVRDTLDRLVPAVFEQSLDDLLAAVSTERAEGGLLARRAMRRRARSLVRPGVHVADLRGALAKAQVERALWTRMSAGGGRPRVPTGLADARAAVGVVLDALSVLDAVLAADLTPTSSGLVALPLDALEALLDRLVADEEGLAAQPRRTVLLAELDGAGLGRLVADLRARRVEPDVAPAELDLAWWAGVLEAIVAGDPRLAHHDGRALRRAGAHFRLADCAHVREGSRRVRHAVAERAAAVCAEHPEQVSWLRAEVARGHRSHWPEDLLRRAPDVVAALRPVWVLSPDAVARLLPPAALDAGVDAVLVDDAGHVAVAEVAAAMARAAQVVVAGDRRRLPPAAGQTSALAAVAPVLGVHRLDHDHRTLDGRVLAPLASRYPEGWRLTPGTAVDPRLRLEHVADGVAVPSPGEETAISPDGEVRRVVGLVAEHARRRPEESLMVVTLGERHAERIEEALRAQVSEDHVLAAWLEAWWTTPVAEPFLVRPVHRVLGIERDDVVVAVGLGSTPHGRVMHRFGLVDEPVGEAALLTALSRARCRTTVVCTFTADQLDPARLRSAGAKLLHEVLAAAASPLPAAIAATGADPDEEPGDGVDALVSDLADRLRRSGMPVTLAGQGSRALTGGRPVDVVVGDPRVAGRSIMAIEVDGPRFAAPASLRERERHRRERYERSGWTYCKVAAMDLFLDPDAEVARLRDLWETALGEVVTGPLPVLGAGSAATAGTPA